MNDAWTTARRVAAGLSPHEALGSTASAQSWAAFDHAVRDLPPYELGSRPGWARSASTTAVALCHPDGRVREAALDHVSRYPALLPLLLVRCADWAAPVRDRARTLLARTPTAGLLAQAPLILLLDRRRQGEFAVDLLDRVLREGPAGPVHTLLASEDRATRRLAHRIAVDRALLPPARLARIAARSGDATLQDLCANAAIASMREEEYGQVLDVLLTARAPRVRAAGVTALRRTGRYDGARAHLADRSSVVRACARYVVRQGGGDPLPLYRALCGGEITEPGAAAGLGECGDRSDAGTLWPLVRHPVPAVRVQAVTGLRALDAVTRDGLAPLLDDPSPPVVRAATRALLPHAAGFPREWLDARHAPDRPRATRVAAQRLLRAAGYAAFPR